MNNKLKTSLLVASIFSSLSGVSYAQQGTQVGVETNFNKGNAFEREITPLLREISRKKSELELRKLDRELEKLDEESLKAQLALENSLNTTKEEQNPGVYNPFVGQPPVPNVLPQPQAVLGQVGTGTADDPIEGNSDIKVLMIYGFDDKLYAKIASGTQGGYVVKKGDVLPNGNIVHNVTANYIEVKKNVKGKGAKPQIQRIFVSTSVPSETKPARPAVPGAIPPGVLGSASSVPMSANDAALSSILAPIASPGAGKPPTQ